MKPPNTPKSAPNPDLLTFYDDFVEFHDHCAFFCEAIACMVAEDEPLDACTIMGIKRFCYWVKDRAGELKGELRAIQDRASRH